MDDHMSSDDGLDGTRFDNYNERNVDDKPKAGMAFQTIEEADVFYNTYGKEKGFNVRRCHKGYNQKKTMVMNAIWECSQAGFSRIRKTPLIRKPKPQTRVGCQACFRVALQEVLYRVNKFVAEHNHELLAPTSNQLKSNRFISPGDKAVTTVMNDARIRTCHILDYLNLAHGGPSNVSFKKKDVYNFINKKRNELVHEGDARTTLYLLDGIRLQNKDFVYESTFDDDHSLTKLFWTDGFLQARYKVFGDAIVLDSTYKTNTYQLPLVIIFGVDNNFKTCVFGAALMCNENTESYVWLFQKFIDAMGGKVPVTIMSDQALSMANGMSEVFPQAKHRLCSWHLLQNCNQNVKKPGFCNALGELMTKNLSSDEFDQHWTEIIAIHGVANDPWVLELYSKKQMWSLSHCRDHFMGMMMSTQRAGSLNAHFKDRGKQGHKISEFLKHYFTDLHKLRATACDSQNEPKHLVRLV